MESYNDFKQEERHPQQFLIEVADGGQGKTFTIRPMGNERYEILDIEGIIGTVQLDESDHARCESQGCELDLPLLHAIRDQIRFHYQLRNNTQ